MHFLTFVLLVVTFGLASCLPPPTSQETVSLASGTAQIAKGLWYSNVTETDKNVVTQRAALDRLCGDSTFENRASPASPKVMDCLKLYDNIAGPGVWTADVFQQHTLATYGSCAFGVDANGGIDGEESIFNVGNDDIRNIIAESVTRFHWVDHGVDKVGTRGVMPCALDGLKIEWGIYHT